MAGLDFGLDYFDEEDNPRKFSLTNFIVEHPKTTAMGLLAAYHGIKWWMENRELFVDDSVTEISAASISAEPVPEVSMNDSVAEHLDPNSEEAKERLGQRKMHLRILVNGQKASPQKQAEANEMNIDLQGKYTLVDSCPFHY